MRSIRLLLNLFSSGASSCRHAGAITTEAMTPHADHLPLIVFDLMLHVTYRFVRDLPTFILTCVHAGAYRQSLFISLSINMYRLLL